MEKFDYAVIGSGPAAFMFVNGMKDSQKRIAVIDGGKFGGICPNAGCEPKIFLEGTVKTVLASRQLLGKGIETPATINWEDLMKRKKQIFNAYPDGSIKNFQANGATSIQETASFIDSHTLKVGDQKIWAEKIVIATGQKPNKLPIEGSELTISSNEVFNLDTLPKRITFIGGGFVSMELAVILNAAGAKVDIVEFADRPLMPFNPEHVKYVVEEMEQQGITFHFNHGISQVEKIGTEYQVTSQQGLVLKTDLVVDASGRVPNLDKLNLDKIGIKTDRGGIVVDGNLQTNMAGIYAAGDVVSKNPNVAPKLTSVAQFEGEYLSGYFQGITEKVIKYPVTATAAFTFPQIAQVGVNVDEARENPDYKVVDHQHMAEDDFFYTGTNDYNAQLSLVFDKTNRLVGASEVSQSAADDIDNFVHLIGLGLTRKDWADKYLPVFPALAYKLRYFA
ncbi:dihydrolipoyl dehydrogenase family protein [Companilactobacillus kimchiensis]|nr:NAD(P)/FAD-dependent oxidoreductase [Companilactobacillus kimchiensis]